MPNDLKYPFGPNILEDGLRPILSSEQAVAALTYLPPMRDDMESVPKKIRLLHLLALRELHIPSPTELRLFDTVDGLVMDSLRIQNPSVAANWVYLRRDNLGCRPRPSALSTLVGGDSGTGKTSSSLNVLSTQPQTVIHENFPNASRPVQQLVWLYCQVPSSGTAVDFAAALMHETDLACGTNRFTETLSRGRSRMRGLAMLEEWTRVVRSSFLAVVHFDEIQNLFKLPTVAKRRAKSKEEERPELRVVEDQCLRWYLNFMNGPTATISSGTPDGIVALTSRFATTQRIVNGGYHLFKTIDSPQDVFYIGFLQELWRYQYVVKRLEYSDAAASLIVELSGGIMRIIIALWVAAHRVALNRKDDQLKESDFRKASDTLLSPLKPAIEAIRSRDTTRIRQFSDMLRGDHEFWVTFWQNG
ncbi:ATP-binding protein [Duganella sp. sic0402]|uniref:AAA family ATPase n=1 Tax=Duganella sp. sic0402 TaxID=2854786 RepID=UPI001C45B56F|nr:AAA family ATPase [Duganella sp. sic0402]MBV7539218.1 ATP-binding protein [Duganella sp. sic0402]